MSNSQEDMVRGRHFESLAAAVSNEFSNLSVGGGASYDVFTGATAIASGLSGLVPEPLPGDQNHFLRGDGKWASIGRDPCTLTLSETSGTVGRGDTITFTVTTPSDGELSVTSSDTDIAAVAINDNVVTVTGVNYGTTTITVSQAAGTDYAAPTPATYSATVSLIVGETLNTTSWNQISAVSQEGLGDLYWDIGDTKEITLNGNVGDYLTLTNETLCVFILHFNYAMNGTADNNIIWGGFKTADGKDVALCDSKYNTTVSDGTICFSMNHAGDVNYGGWKGADLRYDVLGATSTPPSEYFQAKTTANVGYNATAATLTSPKANTLLAALPSDFRNALRLWSRWIDAKGNISNVEANIEETIDAVTLLTEFEVQGARSLANQYEQNHQTQMEYYRLGNSKVKYLHNDTANYTTWFLSSPYSQANYAFIQVRVGGDSFSCYAYSFALGIAPAFMT